MQFSLLAAMWYCVYNLCLINPLNLSNIYPAKNSAKVNPTTKINPLLLPPSDRKKLYTLANHRDTISDTISDTHALTLKSITELFHRNFQDQSAKFKIALSSCGSGHSRECSKAGWKSLFKSSKRAKKERKNAINLSWRWKCPDLDSSKI